MEDLRGSALGFRKLTKYFARSRLEAGGFRSPATPWIRRAKPGARPGADGTLGT